jgi:hypothetical protein
MSAPRLAAVVNLREAPPLTDIAAQLRQLADRIESGVSLPMHDDRGDVNLDHGEVRSAIVLLEMDGEAHPVMHAFGEVMDRWRMAGMFTDAAHRVVTDNF